jgi:hypothetical protein
MSGRAYELAFHPSGDGSAVLTVWSRLLEAWLVCAAAGVRFDLTEPFASPRNRRALRDLRALVGSTLPAWRVLGEFERARAVEFARNAA